MSANMNPTEIASIPKNGKCGTPKNLKKNAINTPSSAKVRNASRTTGAIVMHGKELGADLFRIDLVGREDLPTVAGEYRYAVENIDHAGVVGPTVMGRPAFFGADRVSSAWADLRGTLEKILRESEGALEDTGRALMLAVAQYSAADQEAAAELARLRSEHQLATTLLASHGDIA